MQNLFRYRTDQMLNLSDNLLRWAERGRGDWVTCFIADFTTGLARRAGFHFRIEGRGREI
jgi:hypothetical protein